MDLQLIPVDELIDELFNRYDHAAFIGKKAIKDGLTEDKGRYKGDPHTVMGMASTLQIRLHEEYYDQEDLEDET